MFERLSTPKNSEAVNGVETFIGGLDIVSPPVLIGIKDTTTKPTTIYSMGMDILRTMLPFILNAFVLTKCSTSRHFCMYEIGETAALCSQTLACSSSLP